MDLTMLLTRLTVTLADKGDDKDKPLIPNAKPTPIPGMSGPVAEIFGYALWLLALAGAAGIGFGVYKLAISDKSRHGGGSEPFKWMGGGAVALLLSGTLIVVINGIAS